MEKRRTQIQKKNCYSYLRHLTEKDKGITIIIQRKETLKSILRIKFSLRKHLWKLSVGKDRNVLRFTNTLFINSHDPSHMLEQKSMSFIIFMDRKHEKLHTYSSLLTMIRKIYYQSFIKYNVKNFLTLTKNFPNMIVR